MKALGRGLAMACLAAALLAAGGGPWWSPPGPARLQAAQLQPPDRQGAAAFPPAQAEDVRRALKSAQRSLNFQTELPEPAAPRQRQLSYGRPFLSEGAAKMMLWLAIALAVGAIFWSMKDMWGKKAALEKPEEAGDDGNSAVAQRLDQAQAGADDLARQGDFAGAMHMLLLQSVGELRRRLNVAIAASLTSREILARTSLPPEGRKVFGDIIGRVEISWFGSHQPGQEDYLACRHSFETLSAVLKGLGAPS